MISYRGYHVDSIIGLITGARPDGVRLVAVAASYSAMDDRTFVTYVPVPLGEDRIYRDTDGRYRLPADVIADGQVIPK